MQDFVGVKIALLNNDRLIVIQRDDKPDINFPGLWDFAGGSREDDETPLECVTREVQEELGINLDADTVIFERIFPAMNQPTKSAYFMVANVSDEDIKNIQFGDEGQGWGFMNINEFFERSDVVPDLKGRLQAYLDLV